MCQQLLFRNCYCDRFKMCRLISSSLHEVYVLNWWWGPSPEDGAVSCHNDSERSETSTTSGERNVLKQCRNALLQVKVLHLKHYLNKCAKVLAQKTLKVPKVNVFFVPTCSFHIFYRKFYCNTFRTGELGYFSDIHTWNAARRAKIHTNKKNMLQTL